VKKRDLFFKLKKHLDKKQISLIIGARQTGKTTLMHQIKSHIDSDLHLPNHFLSLEDPLILDILNQHPDKLFQALPPLDFSKRTVILIDEIQYLNNPSNFLKYHYDKYQGSIKFIVSGSSSFYIDEKFKDSMAGRKRIFNLPTLSVEEFLNFKNKKELISLINSDELPAIYVNELNSLLDQYMIYGGYPDVVLETDANEKKEILREIANSYVKKDAMEAGLKHSDAYLTVLRIIAQRIGGQFNSSEIARNFGFSHLTIKSYLRLMEKSFHITTIRPFFTNLSKELKKMPKAYFNDLGLRNFFVNNFQPLVLRQDKGNVFENFVFRRFLDKYDVNDIKYWRSQKKLEVDFIIQNSKAFEVKFSGSKFNRKKYQFFIEKYPEISLKLISYDNVIKTKFE